jgi:hypothetical protein
LKKLYVNRAIDVFLKKLLDWYQIYYQLPRDELYKYLLRNNSNLAAIIAKTQQTKKQLMGLPYEATTPSGSKCTCPATKTPINVIKNLISSDINLTKDDLNSATEKVQQLYDQINQVREKTKIKPCQIADKIINNRNKIYFSAVMIIIVFFILLYSYSHFYGTPNWWYSFVSPIWHFKTNLGMKMILQNQTADYTVYFVIALILIISGYGLYKIK